MSHEQKLDQITEIGSKEFPLKKIYNVSYTIQSGGTEFMSIILPVLF